MSFKDRLNNLPRLGNPTTVTIERDSIFGDNEKTEITMASQFDLLPTWAQYVVVGVSVIPVVLALAVLCAIKLNWL